MEDTNMDDETQQSIMEKEGADHRQELWEQAPSEVKKVMNGQSAKTWAQKFWATPQTDDITRNLGKDTNDRLKKACKDAKVDPENYELNIMGLEAVKKDLAKQVENIRAADPGSDADLWTEYFQTHSDYNDSWSNMHPLFTIPDDLPRRWGVEREPPTKTKQDRSPDSEEPRNGGGKSRRKVRLESESGSYSDDDEIPDLVGKFFNPSADESFESLFRDSGQGRRLKGELTPVAWQKSGSNFKVVVCDGKLQSPDSRFRLQVCNSSEFPIGFFSDAKKDMSKSKRGELRDSNNAWLWTKDDMKAPVGVAWEDQGRGTQHPLCSIEPGVTSFPWTKIGIKWKERDDQPSVVTWETRTVFRRLIGNRRKADNMIYRLAGIREAKYHKSHGLPPIEDLSEQLLDEEFWDDDDDRMTTMSARTAASRRSKKSTVSRRSGATQRGRDAEVPEITPEMITMMHKMMQQMQQMGISPGGKRGRRRG